MIKVISSQYCPIVTRAHRKFHHSPLILKVLTSASPLCGVELHADISTLGADTARTEVHYLSCSGRKTTRLRAAAIAAEKTPASGSAPCSAQKNWMFLTEKPSYGSCTDKPAALTSRYDTASTCCCWRSRTSAAKLFVRERNFLRVNFTPLHEAFSRDCVFTRWI